MAGTARYHPGAPRELERYLATTETVIFTLRRHWLVLITPIVVTAVGFAFILFLGEVLSGWGLYIRNFFVAVWLVIAAWAGWQTVDWFQELFIATDKRLILLHGIITRKVAMMPMEKVTDMRYDRTVLGRVLNYGHFILESAGQDQALSNIKFVTDPDRHYRQISAILFPPSEDDKTTIAAAATSGSLLPESTTETAWWRRG